MKKLFLLLLLFSSFFADGIVIDPYIDYWRPIDERQQLAAINYENGIQKMIITIETNSSERGILWIFPIPADPNKVAIDVVTTFPQLYGYDISEKADRDIKTMTDIMRASQLYPFIFGLFRPYDYGYYERVLGAEKAEAMTYIEGEVVVYEQIEKEGVVVEIVGVKSADALYAYLLIQNLDIKKAAIPVLEEYVGENYTFVIASLSPIKVIGTKKEEIEQTKKIREWRNVGLLVTFPTKEIFYPLKPTSIYGSKKIPISIYILGYRDPKIYSDIDSYVLVRYFKQERFWVIPELSEFYRENGREIKYTKIDIAAPSKYFSEDLWIGKDASAKAIYADIVSTNPIIVVIILFLLSSILLGAVLGKVIFNQTKDFALVGLANCLSIIGLIVATTLVKTKKISKGTKRRLKEPSLIFLAGVADKRKIYFAVAFSILFYIIAGILEFVLKIPLG